MKTDCKTQEKSLLREIEEINERQNPNEILAELGIIWNMK